MKSCRRFGLAVSHKIIFVVWFAVIEGNSIESVNKAAAKIKSVIEEVGLQFEGIIECLLPPFFY